MFFSFSSPILFYMGKGDGTGSCAPGVAPTRRRGQAQAERSAFSGFSSKEEQIAFARTTLERAGLRPGETCVIELDGAGEEAFAAQDAFAAAALEMGVVAHAFPPDHTLSQDEFLKKQLAKRVAAAGEGARITLSSFAGHEAAAEMPLHEDDERFGPTRDALAARAGAKITEARNSGQLRWHVAEWPTEAWASRVYPGLPPSEAQARLADCLARASFAGDPEGLKQHRERLNERARLLNEFETDEVEIFDPGDESQEPPFNRGTSLTVGMAQEQNFTTCDAMVSSEGEVMGVNNPSDEVFGTPAAKRVSGHLTTTRPLVTVDPETGETIELRGVYMEFKDGEMTTLRAMDPGQQEAAERIFSPEQVTNLVSELGLVDAQGALAQERHNGKPVTFYETIPDENTGIHLGLGKSWTSFTGGRGLSSGGDAADPDRAQAHLDIVIGGPRSRVVVRNQSGASQTIIDEGAWTLLPKEEGGPGNKKTTRSQTTRKPCQAKTAAGNPCKNRAQAGSDFCASHIKQAVAA